MRNSFLHPTNSYWGKLGFLKAKKLLIKYLNNSCRLPEINLLDLNLMGCVIAVRPYCQNSCYWQVLFDTNAAILRVAEAANWPAPMPVDATPNP